MPMRMSDGVRGESDKAVVNNWARFDIAKMVTGDWSKYGPVMINEVHLACGEWDSYYLNRAVEAFKAKVDALRGDAPGSGYIILVPKATHETLLGVVGTRFNTEMRQHLIDHGLQDK